MVPVIFRPVWIRLLSNNLALNVAFLVWMLVVLACPQQAYAPEATCSLTPRPPQGGISEFELTVIVQVVSSTDTELLCLDYSINSITNNTEFRVACPNGHCLVNGSCLYNVTADPMLNSVMESFELLLQENLYDISANVSVGYCILRDGVGGGSSSNKNNSGSDDGSGHGSGDESGHGNIDGSGRGNIDGGRDDGSGSGNDNDTKSPSLMAVIILVALAAIVLAVIVFFLVYTIIKRIVKPLPSLVQPLHVLIQQPLPPLPAIVQQLIQQPLSPPIQPDPILKKDGQCPDKKESKKECYKDMPLTSLLRNMEEGISEQSCDMNVVSSTNFNAQSQQPEEAENGSKESIVTQETVPTSGTTSMVVDGAVAGLFPVSRRSSINICHGVPSRASGSNNKVGMEA